MAMRRHYIVGGFFLLRRQAVIERPEGGEEPVGLLRPRGRKARLHFESLERVRRLIAVHANLLERAPTLIRALPQGLGDFLELGFLRRGDLEFGLEEGDAAFDMARSCFPGAVGSRRRGWRRAGSLCRGVLCRQSVSYT